MPVSPLMRRLLSASSRPAGRSPSAPHSTQAGWSASTLQPAARAAAGGLSRFGASRFGISQLGMAVVRRIPVRARPRRWAAAGVVLGALGGVLVAAPASWVAAAVSAGTAQRLLLADAQGSLWQGSAVPVLTGGSGSRDASALPGRLRWQLRPGWLGWGPALNLSLQQDGCTPQPLQLRWQPGWGSQRWTLAGLQPPPDAEPGAEAVGDPAAGATPQGGPPPGRPDLPDAPGGPGGHGGPGGPGGLGAPDAQGGFAHAGGPPLRGRWPVAWLSGLGAPFNTLALGGQFELQADALELRLLDGRLLVQGQLSLVLRDMRSRAAPLPVLGSYQLDVQGVAGRSDSAQLNLRTLQGELLLNASGQWQGGRLRLRGLAQPAPGQEQALSNLLSLIGRRQGAAAVISIG